jgi:hypothetical protein
MNVTYYQDKHTNRKHRFYCDFCQTSWPCDARELADQLYLLAGTTSGFVEEPPDVPLSGEEMDKTTIGQVSCDTEQDEIRNCNHRYIDRFGITIDFRLHFTGWLETLKRYAYCPLCGEEL